MAKKKLTEDNFWAQHVIRAKQDGKEYIFALVRRRYSDDDVETTGPGEYFGLSKESKFAKITDNDPDSDTFGERIDRPNSEPIGVRMKYKDEFTPKNIAKYQKMCGITSFGQTEYIWKFKQINISADKVDEFWDIKQDKAYDKYVLNEQVVVIEKNQPNSRKRNP